MNEIDRINDLIAQRENFCLATIIVSDNPEAPVGRKAIVLADGTMEGSVGPAHLDRALQTLARQTLADKKKRTVKIAEGIHGFLDIHDAECLQELLPQGAAYVGLIGSRRRVRFVLEVLGKKGIPTGRLNEVFTPIGLPIGAESPEEIALTIAAELVCMRRKGALTARALRAASEGSI
ncbi:MAG: XdhC/CoxI family protein [Pseudomonadota bacterium]